MTTVKFRIERRQRDPQWSEYDVPVRERTTVVEALDWIRSHVDATLMYRHSCHHGSCGTCGMLVNGKQLLACTAPVLNLVELEVERGMEPVIELRPLQTMDLIGDLATDPTRLFRDYPVDGGYLRPSEVNKGSAHPEEISGYVRFENCIECGLCVSVCPVIPLRGFMGPAGLAAYNRELDKHPERSDELLPQVDAPEGAWGCDRHLLCSVVCPTGVYPAKQIAVLKRKIETWREQKGDSEHA
ncbi:MAG: 2Fe-2S iron-sulfur cluster-binding protein [Alkalispirochaeta sp.]|jgi:succinate dehydrogenase / fumarate reductase iron-sulfur subunit